MGIAAHLAAFAHSICVLATIQQPIIKMKLEFDKNLIILEMEAEINYQSAAAVLGSQSNVAHSCQS